MNRQLLAVALGILLALPACGDKSKKREARRPVPAKAASAAKAAPIGQQGDHGEATALPELQIGGYTFALRLLGTLGDGHDAAVTAQGKRAPDGADWKRANLYLWAESADGKRLNAPSKAIMEDGKLHLHASVPAPRRQVHHLVFRLREGRKDLRQTVMVAGQAAAPSPSAATQSGRENPEDPARKQPKHSHHKTPHGGILAKLLDTQGGPTGWIEVKLHDDKGDIELWIARDKEGKQPLDLPLKARPWLKFIDHGARKVRLQPRDEKSNPDEGGKPNIRDGKTNYFIFPGDTGADPSWLKGKAFASVVVANIPYHYTASPSEELLLRPHTHGPGGHTH